MKPAMGDRDSLKLRCNAKVNLYLEVLGARQDGYHDIETVFHTISIPDTLTVTRRETGFTLSSGSSDVPHDESNLALVAARRLLGEGRGGVHIDLEKQIPVSAGLGGGSADAAASMVAVERLFGLGLSREELIEAACEIGSDVPFFLLGGCAMGRGRGERLTSLPCLPPLPVIVVAPPLKVSTKWAYESLRTGLTRGEGRSKIKTDALEGAVKSLKSLLYNRFEELVFEKYPLVRWIKESFMQAGALGALMSGSGPAVFGVFEKEGDAAAIIPRFKDEGLSVYRSSFEESSVSTCS